VIKAVVWDLDGTLWPGVALEEAPRVDDNVMSTLDTLTGRGILLAVASRNPASVGDLVEELLPGRFVAGEYGWGRKSDALRRIAGGLGVEVGTLAFVDDDPVERAEVERALPDVVVLAPDEVPDALGWPEFGPGPVTAAAANRAESYRQRERRRAARASFGGSEDDFLAWLGIRATIRPAGPADQDRLAELAARTTQYNSTGAGWAGGDALVLELADRFGDDGLVGLAALGPDGTVPLVAVSCRAGGRGAVPLLLTAVVRRAAGPIRVPCRLTERNVPVRLGLKEAGFAAERRDGDVAVYARDADPAAAYPVWVEVTER
jgi:methoxymalonate biosynthesis protein